MNKEQMEIVTHEKGVWINLSIQVHFNIDDFHNEVWQRDDDEMCDTVKNVVEHELGHTNYCDQYVIDKVHVEDYNSLRRPPQNPTPVGVWELFEQHANELLTTKGDYRLRPLFAAKLIQDYLITTFEQELKDATASGDMRHAVQVESDLKATWLLETYDDIKNFYIEVVRQWEPDRESIVSLLLSILVSEGEAT